MLFKKKKGLSKMAALLSSYYGYEVTVHLVIKLDSKEEAFIVKKKGIKVAEYTPAEMLVLILGEQ